MCYSYSYDLLRVLACVIRVIVHGYLVSAISYVALVYKKRVPLFVDYYLTIPRRNELRAAGSHTFLGCRTVLAPACVVYERGDQSREQHSSSREVARRHPRRRADLDRR